MSFLSTLRIYIESVLVTSVIFDRNKLNGPEMNAYSRAEDHIFAAFEDGILAPSFR